MATLTAQAYGLYDHRSKAGSSVSNQQNMIMLLATAAEVSQQDAPLKVRPAQLVLLRTDLCISGNELARYRMRSCTSRGVRVARSSPARRQSRSLERIN